MTIILRRKAQLPAHLWLLLGFGGLNLAACATTSDVVSLPPAKAVSFAKDAKSLSLCSLAALSAQERGYAFRQIRRGSITVIEAQIATAADTPGQYVQFQIQFEDAGSDKSMVTLRSLKTVWGGYVYPETTWSLISQCAEAQ